MLTEYDTMTFELSKMQSLTCVLRGPQTVSYDLKIPAAVDINPYEGEYDVTPSMEKQTLSTKNRYMLDDVIINPIPSDYGHIVYDGSKILVE